MVKNVAKNAEVTPMIRRSPSPKITNTERIKLNKGYEYNITLNCWSAIELRKYEIQGEIRLYAGSTLKWEKQIPEMLQAMTKNMITS